MNKPTDFDFEKHIDELEQKVTYLRSSAGKAQAQTEGVDLEILLPPLEQELKRVEGQFYNNLSAWQKTTMARHKERPYTLDYIRLAFTEFVELSGDRLGTNDEAIVGGFARLEGRPVVVIGLQKGRDLKERQRRNFGSSRAGGFRKALRLAKLAEKFHMPLISFVDTAGAAADLKSEEQGVSEAIARNLREFALLATPTVSVVIGEGGSGGALGIAVADRVLMLEHSIYSVISPEGCASILWYDKSRANDAAEALRLTAQGALNLGVIDEIIPEPIGGAHRSSGEMAITLRTRLSAIVSELSALATDNLLNERYSRLRRIGTYTEKLMDVA